MKNIKFSTITIIVLSTLSYGGGNFGIITPYEVEDMSYVQQVPVEEYVEPKKEEVYVEPKKEIVPPKVVKVSKEHIYANGFYAGLGIVGARYETNCDSGCSNSGKDTTIGVIGRVGYDFNKYVGLEGRGIMTNFSDDGGTVRHAGVFVKPMIPIGDKSNVYGLVGLAKTTTQGRLQRTDATTLALGAGVEFDLSKDSPKEGRYNREFDGKGDQEKGLGLFVDYEKMVVKSGAPSLDALSAGITYDFQKF